ncbi:MAG: urease accessory UreF family protein [Dongiaceae bacterium]
MTTTTLMATTTGTAMAGEAAGPLLYLLQVANASFPTGAFNHSLGFETWIDAGELETADCLELACRDWLMFGLAGVDGAACAIAYRAAAAGDVPGLLAIDELIGAVKLTREGREASEKTGRSLLGAVRDVFALPGLAVLADAVGAGRCAGHQAVVFGAAGAAAGVSEEETVLAFLQVSLANLVGVGARLIPLGQIDAQRIVRRAWPLLGEATATARATPPERLGAATAGLDVAGMRHERLYTRLCMS